MSLLQYPVHEKYIPLRWTMFTSNLADALTTKSVVVPVLMLKTPFTFLNQSQNILTFTKFPTLSLLDKQFIQEFVMKNRVLHSKLCGNTCTMCRPEWINQANHDAECRFYCQRKTAFSYLSREWSISMNHYTEHLGERKRMESLWWILLFKCLSKQVGILRTV